MSAKSIRSGSGQSSAAKIIQKDVQIISNAHQPKFPDQYYAVQKDNNEKRKFWEKKKTQ